jgi:hypothetical protein
MREKLRALYYPDFWIDYPTLIKCILLFDEIHFMDRPSHTFDGQSLKIGMASPIRQHEKWFRDQGVPLYVHEPPSGPVVGELLAAVERDLSDIGFLTSYQEGLKSSRPFRNLQIQPGNYGNGETQDTILQKLFAIDLKQCPAALEILKNGAIRPYDFTTPEGTLKTMINQAAICSTSINFALEVGATQSFSPLADMSPYAKLLSSKYTRAIKAAVIGGAHVSVTDLSVAILDELVPTERISDMTIDHAIKIRKECESERDAFLEHIVAMQLSLGKMPVDSDYSSTINKIIKTEIRPAAKDYQSKLKSIWEKLLGNIAVGAVTWAGSSAVIQLFGDINWPRMLLGATSFVAAQTIGAIVEERAATRECALSFLLNIGE